MDWVGLGCWSVWEIRKGSLDGGYRTENDRVMPTALQSHGHSAHTSWVLTVPDSMLLDVSFLELYSTLLGGCYYGAQITKEETGAQSGELICPRLRSQGAMKLCAWI